MRRLFIIAVATVLVIGAATIAASFPGDHGPRRAARADSRAPVVLVLGDSYTMGIGQIRPEQTFAADTARTLGWQIVFGGHAGTGFVERGVVGKNFSTLFDEQFSWRPAPDMVMVSGGHNDWKYPPPEVGAAAAELLAKIKTRWPRIGLVLMGPLWGGDPPPRPLLVRDAMRAAAATAGVPFVDPLEGRWITGNVRRRTGNAPLYIRGDGIHPNPIGNAYISDRLVSSLRALGLDQPRRGAGSGTGTGHQGP